MPLNQAVAVALLAVDYAIRKGQDDRDRSLLRAQFTLEQVDPARLRELDGKEKQ
jgi:hypothetical protein